jgi:pSer/pThr/pTyr-binding forkhead associated (FHA) protein
VRRSTAIQESLPQHCIVAQDGDVLRIRDLGSTNGIRINGEKLVEGVMKPGDELTIGAFVYKIAVVGSSSEVIVEEPDVTLKGNSFSGASL